MLWNQTACRESLNDLEIHFRSCPNGREGVITHYTTNPQGLKSFIRNSRTCTLQKVNKLRQETAS